MCCCCCNSGGCCKCMIAGRSAQVRPSVSSADLKAFEEWNLQFGSFQNQQAKRQAALLIERALILRGPLACSLGCRARRRH